MNCSLLHLCPSPVAVSHGIWQLAWCLCALWHHLCTHWCHRHHFAHARTPLDPAPSDWSCQSFCWAAAGHHRKLAVPPNLQEVNITEVSLRWVFNKAGSHSTDSLLSKIVFDRVWQSLSSYQLFCLWRSWDNLCWGIFLSTAKRQRKASSQWNPPGCLGRTTQTHGCLGAEDALKHTDKCCQITKLFPHCITVSVYCTVHVFITVPFHH